jgi:hypothetical protein
MTIIMETTDCVQVKIRVPKSESSSLLVDVARFALENDLTPVTDGNTYGSGMYSCYHTKEDAEKIKQFVQDALNKKEQ